MPNRVICGCSLYGNSLFRTISYFALNVPFFNGTVSNRHMLGFNNRQMTIIIGKIPELKCPNTEFS